MEWLRDLAETKLDSRAIDETRTIPRDLIEDLGNAGLFGMAIPTELGGLGLSHRDMQRVVGQLAAIDTTLGIFVGAAGLLAVRPILAAAPSSERDTMLRKIASGKCLAAFALTEPGAGSNPRALSMVARPDGAGRWRLSGRKWWIGSGSEADVIITFCRLLNDDGTSPGITAFAVSGDAPGLTCEREVPTMGLRGMVQAELLFEDVPVDQSAMLGLPGEGFGIARDALAFGRLSLAFGAIGGMHRCIQLMHRYASRRTVGTGLLLDNPVTRTRLTKLIAKSEALDALISFVAESLDDGRTIPDEVYSVLKLALEFHWEAADLLVQMLGGRGYDEGNLAPQMLRDARVLRIFEGPNEVHEAAIGQALLNDGSALPHVLSRELGNVEEAEALTRLVTDIKSHGVDPSTLMAARHAPALAQAALYGILSAALSHAALESKRGVDPEFVESMRQQAASCRQSVISSITESEPSSSAKITQWAAAKTTAFGDVEQGAASASLDPYLQRDPSAWQALGHPGAPDASPGSSVSIAEQGHLIADAIADGTIAQVCRILAKVCAVPVSAITPNSV
ncbi:MAG: acyl-CoA dehydrogenase family protein, partial [Pseudomonadota bacterium]